MDLLGIYPKTKHSVNWHPCLLLVYSDATQDIKDETNCSNIEMEAILPPLW